MQSAQQISEQQQSKLLRSWQEALHRGWCITLREAECWWITVCLPSAWISERASLWKVLISPFSSTFGRGKLPKALKQIKQAIPWGRWWAFSSMRLQLPALFPGGKQPLTDPGCCLVLALRGLCRCQPLEPALGCAWQSLVIFPPAMTNFRIPGAHLLTRVTTGEPSQAGQQKRNRWDCSGKGMFPNKSHQKYLFYEQRLISLICYEKKKKNRPREILLCWVTVSDLSVVINVWWINICS